MTAVAPHVTRGSLIASGRMAEVYAWHDDQALQLFRAWCPPAWVQHELEVGRIVAATGLPTPRPVEEVVVAGRQGLVYDHVQGPTMRVACTARPWLVVRLARRLAELHATIHAHEVHGLPPVRATLRATIEEVETLPPTLKASVLRLLAELPDGSTLCHFDLHPDQVLLAADGPVVIDWSTALHGDPHADVARTSVILMLGRLSSGGAARRAIVDVWRRAFHAAYLAHYCRLRPRTSRARIAAWRIPVAAARLNERIAGEREPLVRLIESELLAAGERT